MATNGDNLVDFDNVYPVRMTNLIHNPLLSLTI